MYTIKIDKTVTPWTYHVYETKTESIIRQFPDWTEASDYIEFLKGGGAFAGWTPSFVLKGFQNVIA